MSELARKEIINHKPETEAVLGVVKLAGYINLKRTIRHDDGSLRVLYPLPLFSVLSDMSEDQSEPENEIKIFNQSGLILAHPTPDNLNNNIVQIRGHQISDYDQLFPPESIYAHAEGSLFKQAVAANSAKELGYVRLPESDMVRAFNSGILAVRSILGVAHGLRYDYPEALELQDRFSPDQFRKG